jgi:hypothetical protein
MEEWNVGFIRGGCWEECCPLFHYSNIPIFHIFGYPERRDFQT